MTILNARVISVKFITSPSGQIKPRVLVKTDNDTQEREIAFNNFFNLYDKVIIAGTQLEFKDRYQFSSLIKATPNTINIEDKRTLLLDLIKKCSACGHETSRYKLNYWCTNLECPSSKNNRVQLILKYSPILKIYDRRRLVSFIKRNSNVSILDFIGPEKIDKYLLTLGNRRLLKEHQNIETIKRFYMKELRNWSVIDKLCCLDARIKQPVAKILSQEGRVNLGIIVKYVPKDMFDLGIKRAEASKIHQHLRLEYNKSVINEILRIEKIVGEYQDGFEK